MLNEGQSGNIGAEKLRGLLKILPEADEVSMRIDDFWEGLVGNRF